jgi:hypothetical protein
MKAITQNNYPNLYERYSLFVREICADEQLFLSFADWANDEYDDIDEAEAVAGLKTAIYASANGRNKRPYRI